MDKSFGYDGIVVATKADKISKGIMQKHKSNKGRKLGVEDKNLVIPYSAVNKTNVENTWIFEPLI